MLARQRANLYWMLFLTAGSSTYAAPQDPSSVSALTPPNELRRELESRKSALHFHPSIQVDNPQLQKRIYFWKKIFSWYGPNTAVLHHTQYPWIVYKVINLSESMDQLRSSSAKKLWWERRLQQEIQKQRDILYDLAVKSNQVRPQWTEEERKLLRKFKGLPAKVLMEAMLPNQFRVQRGMKHEFKKALSRSEQLLPEMERILQQHSVPTELAALPFIESMFNSRAESYAGAMGLWQLMPDTARMFGLNVSPMEDDRRHPLKSTHAAARFLRSYYGQLRSWPLTITAYNHGMRGIQNAVQSIGTRDLAELIHQYKGRAFGFAAQNFFAEFMAALELNKFTEQYFEPTSEVAKM